jgi:hypothetical protein
MRNAAILFIFLLLFCPRGAAAVSCSDPPGAPGTIVLNKDFDTFQGCTYAGQWVAFHEQVPPVCQPTVNQSQWASRSNTGTLQKAFDADTGAGSQILVFVALMGSTIPDNGVTDSQSNSYAKIYTGPSIGSTRQYVFSTTHTAAGPLSITVTPASSGGDGLIWTAVELRNADVTSFDVSANQSAGSGHVALAAGPTTQPGALSFAFIDLDTNHATAISPPAGWTHAIYKNHGTLSAYAGDAVMSLSYAPVPAIQTVAFAIDFSAPAWSGRAALFAFKPDCE